MQRSRKTNYSGRTFLESSPLSAAEAARLERVIAPRDRRMGARKAPAQATKVRRMIKKTPLIFIY